MTTRRGFWLAALLATAAASPAVGQQPQKQAPPAALPLKAVAVPALKESTLANGLRLLVVERHDLPIANLSLYVGSGEAADPVAKKGLASLTADLVTKGTAKRSAQEIAQAVEGAGGNISSYAGTDYTVVSVSALAGNLPLAFDVLSDMARNSSFPADELETARKRALSALQLARSQPSSIAQRVFSAQLYGASSPYGASETAESLGSITAADVKAFYGSNFRAGNALLVVSGDVDALKVRALAGQWFGALPAGAPTVVTLAAPPAVARTQILLVHRPGSVQSNILVGSTTVLPASPDYRPLQVGTQVLGGGPDSRLFMILREQKSWTYGAYASVERPRLLGSFVANAEVRTAVTDSAVAEMLKQIARLSTETVPATDLNAAKGFLAGSFPLRLQSAGAVATQVAQLKMLGLPVTELTLYPQKVNAVTAASIQSVARKYLDPQHLVIVVVGDAPKVKASLEKLAPVTVLDIDGKPLEAGSLEVKASAIKLDGSLLKPMTATYAFNMQGNTMGTATLTLAREADQWVARQDLKMAMVNQTAELHMKADDLTPISVLQTSTAGPTTFTTDLKLAGGKVTGTAALPPQLGGNKTFDAAVPAGTMLPGIDEFAMMVMSLQAGQMLTLPTFSIRSGAVENASYKVVAEESVTVPAGTFQTYKVELTGEQPRTEWLRKELPHLMVKQEMIGMPVTVELQTLK